MDNSPLTPPSCGFGVFFADFFFQLLLNFILQLQHQKNNFRMLNFKQLCFYGQFTSDPSFMWFWCIFRGFFLITTKLHLTVLS